MESKKISGGTIETMVVDYTGILTREEHSFRMILNILILGSKSEVICSQY